MTIQIDQGRTPGGGLAPDELLYTFPNAAVRDLVLQEFEQRYPQLKYFASDRGCTYVTVEGATKTQAAGLDFILNGRGTSTATLIMPNLKDL